MEVYKRESRRIVWRFCHHQLSFPKCISALDASLARLIPVQPAQLDELRELMLSNNGTVMEEMALRAKFSKPRWSLGTDN